MKQTLWGHIKSHYESKSLPPRRRRALEKMIHQAASSEQDGLEGRFRLGFAPFRWAALGVLSVFVALGLGLYFGQTGSPENLTRRIVNEISMNHNKNLNVEVTGNIASFASKMSKLDFVPFLPVALQELETFVEGARYCSIQGHLAVQIRLRNKEGRRLTLYETVSHPDLEGAKLGRYEKSGLTVRLWEEKGLFFGLAEPVPSN